MGAAKIGAALLLFAGRNGIFKFSGGGFIATWLCGKGAAGGATLLVAGKNGTFRLSACGNSATRPCGVGGTGVGFVIAGKNEIPGAGAT